MAIKYQVNYKDIENQSHRIDIIDDDYVGNITFVQGRANLDYSQTDDILEPIRGCGLSVELEADLDLTFSDLYSSQERKYKVDYYRNNVRLFQGFLDSEGFYEDLVNDKWKVNFNAIDGTGYLQDLAFVDSDGLPFTGLMKELDIIYNALDRIGVSKSMAVSIRIHYDGLANNVDILNNVYNIAERFYKDDEETIMSCKEVISSILEVYGAILVSNGDEWLITRPRDVARIDNLTYYLYNENNVSIGTETRSYWQDVGDKSSYSPYFCNGNQQRFFRPSLGAYRVSYKYGLRESILENDKFYSPDGVLLDDWTITDATYLTLENDGYGLTYETNINYPAIETIYSNTIPTLNEGTVLNFYCKYDITTTDPDVGVIFGMRLKLIPSVWLGVNYYLTFGGAWVTDEANFPIISYSGGIHELTSEPFPVDGELVLSVYQPNALGLNALPGTTFDTKIEQMALFQEDGNNLLKKGEFHTSERLDNPNPQIDQVKEVYTADNEFANYEGAKYKNDEETATSVWTRTGFSETKPILQIMVEERLRLQQLPSKVFSGDFYGYIPFSSYLSIQGSTERYVMLKYTYNTKENVTSVECRQVYTSDLSDEENQIGYERTYDYGNVVRPTIKS